MCGWSLIDLEMEKVVHACQLTTGNLSMSEIVVGVDAYVLQYQYCLLVLKEVIFFYFLKK